MLENCDEEAEGELASETIPLDKAESRLLFSEDGVRAGLEVGVMPLPPPSLTATTLPLLPLAPLAMGRELGAFTENLFEVRMSMSAWVISSSIKRWFS